MPKKTSKLKETKQKNRELKRKHHKKDNSPKKSKKKDKTPTKEKIVNEVKKSPVKRPPPPLKVLPISKYSVYHELLCLEIFCKRNDISQKGKDIIKNVWVLDSETSGFGKTDFVFTIGISHIYSDTIYVGKMNTFPWLDLSADKKKKSFQNALDVNHLTVDEIQTFEDPKIVLNQILSVLETEPKSFCFGWNVSFDKRMIQQTVEKAGARSWSSVHYLSGEALVAETLEFNKSKKLTNVAAFASGMAPEEIDSMAHFVEGDVEITKRLLLCKDISKGGMSVEDRVLRCGEMKEEILEKENYILEVFEQK